MSPTSMATRGRQVARVFFIPFKIAISALSASMFTNAGTIPRSATNSSIDHASTDPLRGEPPKRWFAKPRCQHRIERRVG